MNTLTINKKMTKTDILIQKDQEIKRLNEQIYNLQERINSLNISIGSKDEVLKSKVKELEKELELARDQQKVIITSESDNSNNTYVCSNCGYTTNTSRSYCPNCGYSGSIFKSFKNTKTTYKNLDTELSNIKRDVEKQMKKSVASLEDIQLDLEIKIETLENELKRKDKKHNSEIDSLQSKNLDRINEYREQIEDLNSEIIKIKKNKTEEELEAKRQEEVIKLKDANTKLVEKIAELEKVGFWRRLWNRIFIDRIARRQAIVEVLKANQLTKKLEATREYNWNRSGNSTSYKIMTV